MGIFGNTQENKLKKQFEKRRDEFLQYTSSHNLLEGELTQAPLFFQASPVKDYIAFGAEHNEFLQAIVESFSEIADMDVYRGCMTGYLIGLYGESRVVNEKTDSALGNYFQRILSLDEQYMVLVCGKLGINPEKLEEDESHLEAFYNYSPQSLLGEASELVSAWMGTGMLALGLMSRISDSFALREQLRQDKSLVARCNLLGNYLQNVGFIPYILDMVERENVILISPETQNGVEVSLKEIDSNNVFFTLLQFALYHEGMLEALGAQPFEYREVIERIATHQYVAEEEYPQQISEQGCFGYYSTLALRPDGSYDEMRPVWGEGTLFEVPKLDGRYVILLTKPHIQRSWSNAFVAGTHSGLHPEVKVLRKLSEEEVRKWLDKIERANKELYLK